MEKIIDEIASKFLIKGVPVNIDRHGNGHINETFKVETPENRSYILQKINTGIFTNVPVLMRSIVAVTEHLRKMESDPRRVLTIVETRDAQPFLQDEEGGYWRMFDFISDSVALNAATPAVFFESGIAFGRFQSGLSDFDISQITETIPRFHDTPYRYELLKTAIKNNAADRLKDVQKEIDYALSKENCANTLLEAVQCGELPVRVTHNDTKLNNVLFDKFTQKSLCVIDLDTVMPGLSVNDFGDAIRFGASTAAEDERDLGKVSLSLEMFEAFANGYCGNADLCAAELHYLCDGAKMMTLENGVRFLTDYLNKDIYFNISHPTQNLNRSRTQFKLVAEMEEKWDKMRSIISKLNR